MKLAPKLTLGYVVSALLVIIVGAVSYRAVVEVEVKRERIVSTVLPNLQLLNEIETAGVRIMAISNELIWMHAYSADKSQSEDWEAELVELQEDALDPYDAAISQYRKIAEDLVSHEIIFVEPIEEWGERVKSSSLHLIELQQMGATLAELNDVRKEMEVNEKGFMTALETAKMHEAAELESETDILQAELEKTLQTIVIGSAIACLTALFLGLFWAHKISRPIIALENAAKALGEGDVNARVNINTRDEIGSLARSFNAMGDALGNAAAVFENTSEGVLITDKDANITAVNKAFELITGYQEHEVLGQNARIIKSNKHDKAFYRDMWGSIIDNGMWRGEILNRNKKGDVFPVWQSICAIYDKEHNVSHYVSVFSDITTIKQSQAQLDYLAYHDPLTGLPNRLLFEDRLEHAIEHAKREQNELAVLFLDLDRFKNINDSLGHPVGDKLLTKVSKRLSSHVRQEDTIVRLGGDEFVIILERLDTREDAAALAQKIINDFHEPFVIDGHNLAVTTSIGISMYPSDGDDVPTLVKNADAALYHAKENGRNCFRFYTSELTTHVVERLAMENALRGALKGDQLILYYQPIISFETGRLAGAEALLRWEHPEHGLIFPNKFISLAEDTGLIISFGAWVLQQACQQAKTWLDNNHALERVSVNVSGLQIQRKYFIGIVKEALETSGLDGRHLELEITENMLMQNTDKAVAILNELKELGVQISIDDFGTGYSSMSYLKQLPIDKLKIDQSFVRDIPIDSDDRAITRAITALAKSLHLKVVAEGIESIEQEDFLKKLGCEEGQGFLYSKPLCTEEFEALLEKDVSYTSVLEV
ncbi:MAG: EAL domain-containing protein [Gammaproteobacteria bacterium]|nr:EAL domain-containing protein [Gammaproteobacteria bacterium]